MKKLVSFRDFVTICDEFNIQRNHLFACYRKTLGISQAKLAYILDHERITQNAISRYEYKCIVTSDIEYILWNWLINEMNKTYKKSKCGTSRYVALFVGGFQLYILRYANNKQAYMLQAAMIEAWKIIISAK